MTISEETLMAFADGEVDDATRAAVENAMREDPQVSKRVDHHRALRKRLQAGFAGELSEPVPERLLALLRDTPSASGSNVVQLARAARARAAQPRAATFGRSQRARAWPRWRAAASIAASVLLGLGIGYGMWRQGGLPIGRDAAGTLIANGLLDGALSRQLSAEHASAGAVRIGLSFLAKSGEYCRTFTLAAAAAASGHAAQASGMACRRDGQWHVLALTQEPAARGDTYRPAATALPAPILKMVEDEIQGEPLDAAGEAAARHQQWQSLK